MINKKTKFVFDSLSGEDIEIGEKNKIQQLFKGGGGVIGTISNAVKTGKQNKVNEQNKEKQQEAQVESDIINGSNNPDVNIKNILDLYKQSNDKDGPFTSQEKTQVKNLMDGIGKITDTKFNDTDKASETEEKLKTALETLKGKPKGPDTIKDVYLAFHDMGKDKDDHHDAQSTTKATKDLADLAPKAATPAPETPKPAAGSITAETVYKTLGDGYAQDGYNDKEKGVISDIKKDVVAIAGLKPNEKGIIDKDVLIKALSALPAETLADINKAFDKMSAPEDQSQSAAVMRAKADLADIKETKGIH